jgi:hypothetical protein
MRVLPESPLIRTFAGASPSSGPVAPRIVRLAAEIIHVIVPTCGGGRISPNRWQHILNCDSQPALQPSDFRELLR